jgi:uncharacterized protein YfiM (DUF2279 family)
MLTGCILVATLLACVPLPPDPVTIPSSGSGSPEASPGASHGWLAGRAHEDRAQVVDPWIGEDKIRHFSMSYAIVAFGYGGARTVGVADGTALRGAVAASAIAGVLKEVHDRARGGIFSYRDIAWNLGGIAAGAVLASRLR